MTTRFGTNMDTIGILFLDGGRRLRGARRHAVVSKYEQNSV
jgi:hypothetical protein